IEDGSDTRLARYVDMVEENVVREDLTFAEMAQVAMSAADDAGVEEVDADALVGRLYGALHKTKRSYIRAFVFMLTHLGEDLRWPKAVARNLGVDVSRAMRHVDQVAALRADLRAARDEAAQTRILTAFVAAQKAEAKGAAKDRRVRVPKLEFHVGQTKVTARGSECRIVSAADYSQIPRERLERAIKAFEDELHGKARIRTP
ncbi:MAG: chromosome partitioning protein ParB, partial [Pseudomonadota bacterium]